MHRARTAGGLAALATSLAAAAPASAAGLLSTSVNVPDAVARDCQAKLLESGGGYAQKTVTMPAAGLAGARLDAPAGDWDLAVFDKRTGARSPPRPASAPVRWPRASPAAAASSCSRPAGAPAARRAPA